MYQDVFIIGATGKVGRTLISQIFDKKDADETVHQNPTRIVGVASGTSRLYSPLGISREQIADFLAKTAQAQPYSKLTDLIHAAKDSDKVVFIDVTALNDEMKDFHLEVICNTQHSIVTANKNPVALSDYGTFQKLTADPRRYGYRCSVMAGAMAVPFLRDFRDLNDNLVSIEGCFSGTLGYISSELEKGGKFSEILHEAYAKGYTEPNPRDDLSGVDVCRKLVVLARTAGFNVGMADVNAHPFILYNFYLKRTLKDS